MGGYRPVMVPPNASISMGTKKAVKAQDIKNNEHNDNFIFTGDANLRHEPKYYVRMWNLSTIEQRIERPWVRPGHVGKIIVLPPPEPGEQLGTPFVIPDIVQMAVDQAGNWELGTRGVDGKFLAQDALNPEDMRGSWKTIRKKLTSNLSNEGTNLYHWGCFWDTTKGLDLDQPPPEDAVKKTIERMEDNYNRLIDEAQMLSLDDKTRNQIGYTHRVAANYFGRSFTWNIRYERQNPCANCGTSLPATASRCYQCKRVINLELALREGTITMAEAIASGMIPGQAEAMAKGKKSRASKQTP
jgi:hypothetical protein